MGGVGPYLSAFNQAYLGSRQLGNQERRQGMEEALTLEGLRKQAQEEQDIGVLSGAFQARRQAQAAPQPAAPAPAPQMPAPPTPGLNPDQIHGMESAGIPMSPSKPIPAGPTPGAPPVSAPGEAPRRESLLSGLDPMVAGRLLGSQRGRAAVRDLEEIEKEHDAAEAKRKANEIFGEANAAIKAGDPLAFYDHMGRAMRTLGDYKSAAQYTEHAMNLRGDPKEEATTAEDTQRWLRANSAYQADPTPENYQKFLDELGIANSKSSRALRQKLAENMLAKTFDQNPQVAMFQKGITQATIASWDQGKEADPAQVWREAIKANPQGFNAYLFDAVAKGKPLPEVLTKDVLRWNVPDMKGKTVDQFVLEHAWAATSAEAKRLGLPLNDPKMLELQLHNVGKALDVVKASQKKDDTHKEALASYRAAQSSLNAVRGLIARDTEMKTTFPQRYAELLEEEKMWKEKVEYLGKQAGIDGPKKDPAQAGKDLAAPADPEKPVRTVEIPVQGPGKLKPGEEKYGKSRDVQIGRLKQAGYTKDQIRAMMKKAGWSLAL